jgi:hypothetical protein
VFVPVVSQALYSPYPAGTWRLIAAGCDALPPLCPGLRTTVSRPDGRWAGVGAGGGAAVVRGRDEVGLEDAGRGDGRRVGAMEDRGAEVDGVGAGVLAGGVGETARSTRPVPPVEVPVEVEQPATATATTARAASRERGTPHLRTTRSPAAVSPAD